MILRHIAENILEALKDTPVIFIRGARQTGKSTLAQGAIQRAISSQYLTLDSAATLSAARSDPAGFLSGLERAVIIDEVQKAPELFPAIKIAVDTDRQPGKFVLTGSSNILTSLKMTESLAGRMEVFNLWPFSQGEIDGAIDSFIDAAFDSDRKHFDFQIEDRNKIYGRILRGGYPEVVDRATERRRRAWFDSYITTILERDVRDIANIQDITTMTRLLKVLAARASSLLNYSEISRSLAIPQTTLKRYMALLKSVFLIYELPAWHSNLGKRFVKSPKIMFSDTGLLSNTLGFNLKRLSEDLHITGGIVENFIVAELLKQSAWNEKRVELFHFRDRLGSEVDVVLEDGAGRVVGIEVKSSATVSATDFSGLKKLKEMLGDRFVRGILLYLGNEAVPFGKDLYAMPATVCWGRHF